MNLWITIPVFNESKVIRSLLDRLNILQQTDEFNVVFCDNNSTDNTAELISQFIEHNSLQTSWFVTKEIQKGTGAAADTAIRFAIKEGATHVARTDADCLPELGWTEKIKILFKDTQLRMISGRITARLDDTDITERQANLFNVLVPLSAWFGKHRPLNRGKQYYGPYVMTAGCNMAIEASLYQEAGGFPRTKIEDSHEDHILVNKVRELTSDYAYCKEVQVQVSARRITEWGIIKTLKWYANHSYKPEVVDIR